MKKRILYIASIILTTLATQTKAQERPVGYWRSHLPYNTAVSLAWDGGSKLHVATDKTYFIYDIATKESEGFSKTEGMSDIGMSCIGFDKATSTTILGYSNGNIDLYQDGSFFNIPDLKLKSVTGSKNINTIHTIDGYAYLSTDVGIIVIDLERREVKENYVFSVAGQNIGISEVAFANNRIYAATQRGLYSNNINAINLQAFSSWTKHDTTRAFISVAAMGSQLFVTGTDSLFELKNNALQFVYRSDTNTARIDAGIDGLWISEIYAEEFSGKSKKIAITNYQILDSFKVGGYCRQTLQTSTQNVWLADALYGLNIREGKGDPYGVVTPDGPSSFPSYDIFVYNNEVWVAHGGYDDKYKATSNPAGFSGFVNGKWQRYGTYSYKPFEGNKRDFSRIIKTKAGNLYAGSFQNGLFVLNADGTTEAYEKNSFIDSSSVSGTWRIIGGFAEDDDNNLWMTVYGGKRELVVRTKDGNYIPIEVPLTRTGTPNAAMNIIVDDYGQKWYATTGAASGVVVYNDNKTPSTTFDDTYTLLLSGKGAGGLADNEVYCLANDKSGSIWIGTKNGISIVSCPSQVIAGTCEAENRIVQYDDFAGYLFQGEVVKTIAVDGANRKWIGTNNGVWLISADGDKIVNRFTADNSPLPSNIIQKITINPATGDVYIGTEEGLVSYRGTATDGGKENKDVLVFPNPIKSGYNGTIAIKGLVENADVRITDISGQLVYRTKALGGQAVWNGLDYTGRRPQSGVYLVFTTNKDGSQTNVAKMVFME
ncbi:MAG: T9SS type A sorting domain-containing protein [Chitinophagales bacterium]|nr:T9SS type A sorting domain-containing protein [Chitinophagales bacterium]